jgi:hypothetical protein
MASSPRFLRLMGAAIVMLITACASSSNNPPPKSASSAPATATTGSATYDQQTVIREATGVFGEGAEGLGKIVEQVFNDLGEPNAYIVGQEASAAIIAGVRYGDGILYHKIEGERKVHWNGPSVGFDLGGDASKSFTLVYNLNDTEDLYRRYPAIEGKLYFVGGFSVNYHQRDNVILAPIRLGAGWRLGANIGYIHYSKKRRFIPL